MCGNTTPGLKSQNPSELEERQSRLKSNNGSPGSAEQHRAQTASKLTDGSSHSCPEPRGEGGDVGSWWGAGLGFKDKRGGDTLMASASSLLDDAGIQFKERAAGAHQLARDRARRPTLDDLRALYIARPGESDAALAGRRQ
ncbi:unnamed protein product [Pleuronectes platessa]|uniref:Uncharacterized protein n=1 Tax=Pleuronectes platessa TaxID=8262 RepID=A0A9N7VCJ7_PLEPL|nr:unnamed protein product [Pleuronectes platessa]